MTYNQIVDAYFAALSDEETKLAIAERNTTEATVEAWELSLAHLNNCRDALRVAMREGIS